MPMFLAAKPQGVVLLLCVNIGHSTSEFQKKATFFWYKRVQSAGAGTWQLPGRSAGAGSDLSGRVLKTGNLTFCKKDKKVT
jgi:hypothetical protein